MKRSCSGFAIPNPDKEDFKSDLICRSTFQMSNSWFVYFAHARRLKKLV